MSAKTASTSAYRKRLIIVFALASMALLAPSGVSNPAEAAFPGRNGRIIFHARTDPLQHSPVASDCFGYGPCSLLYRDNDLFTVSPSGAGLTRITSGPEKDLYPDWSPDGRLIAFTRRLSDFDGDIYVMAADGTGLVNLTNTPAFDDWGPSWSPDGKRIAFSSSRSETSTAQILTRGDEGLYVMNADGTEVRQLADVFAVVPEWSPDGAWIAVSNFKVGGIDLIDLSGRRRALLLPRRNVGLPDWSPDGKRLAFSTYPSGDVMVVNADGSGLRNLTQTPRQNDYAPTWSPDGRFIAFVRNRGGTPYLYRMNTDGSHVAQLIDIQLSQETVPDWGPRP